MRRKPQGNLRLINGVATRLKSWHIIVGAGTLIFCAGVAWAEVAGRYQTRVDAIAFQQRHEADHENIDQRLAAQHEQGEILRAVLSRVEEDLHDVRAQDVANAREMGIRLVIPTTPHREQGPTP